MAAALVVVVSALFSQAQSANDRGREPRRANPNAERASGVIIKVEPIGKGESSGSKDEGESRKARSHRVSRRLTINTAAVWRDWARDQVINKPTESAKAESAEGANSVATKGEPAAKDSLVVVAIGPQTKVETRFRLVDDETSKGYKTPEEARSANTDPAAEKPKELVAPEGIRAADPFQGGRPESRPLRRGRLPPRDGEEEQEGEGCRRDRHRDPARRARGIVGLVQPWVTIFLTTAANPGD